MQRSPRTGATDQPLLRASLISTTGCVNTGIRQDSTGKRAFNLSCRLSRDSSPRVRLPGPFSGGKLLPELFELQLICERRGVGGLDMPSQLCTSTTIDLSEFAPICGRQENTTGGGGESAEPFTYLLSVALSTSTTRRECGKHLYAYNLCVFCRRPLVSLCRRVGAN